MESGKDGVIHSLPPKQDGDAGTSASGAIEQPQGDQESGGEPKRLVEEVELSREDILGAKDTQRVKVSVDEWKKGGFVWVQTPTAADRDHLERVILAGKNEDGTARVLGKDQIRAAFVALSVVNSDGTRKFKGEDIEALSKKSIVPMERLYNAILMSSIITEKDVDTLAKNSGAASSDTSS